ncbi:hypothetical protein Kuura_049 [Caulobacter phage Kuura]|nr:hypothetical protein Kuura_049 [Caulobacter phage Kuura]
MFLSLHTFRSDPSVDVALTFFNPDGSRLVVGPLGTVRYDADGTASWAMGEAPSLAATVRSDLCLGEPA